MIITFALAAVYVVVLAVTLVLVLVYLRRAAGLAKQLARGLDQVARQTESLPDDIATINQALSQLLQGLSAVGGHYRRLVVAAGLKSRPTSAARGEAATRE